MTRPPMPTLVHAPAGYDCPLCKVVAGAEREAVVYQDATVVAALALHQKPRNPGGLLVFPRAHVESLYTASPAEVSALFTACHSLALALKLALSAEGVTIVQNNEPAGGQDVWHLHAHVLPRYDGDRFHASQGAIMSMADRHALALRLRAALAALDAVA